MTRGRRVRVLLVESARGLTGSVRSMMNVAPALQRHGVDFVWASPPNPQLAREVAEHHVLDVALPRRSLAGALRWTLGGGFDGVQLARLARRVDADVVHVNDFYNTSGVFARPWLRGVPLVYHVRLMPDAYLASVYRPLTTLASAAARLVVCPSEAVRRALSAPGALVVPDAMAVPEACRTREDDGVVRVLVLAHFIPGKGQDHAIEAFARAHAADPRLRLRLVGGDNGLEGNRAFRARLRERVATLGLGDVVEFASPTHDVRGEYAKADIVLNMSESESFSMVCLEALMFGVALVASDCGGPRELFVDGVGGILVPNRGVERAATALIDLARDPARRREMAAAGRAYAAARFDVVGIADRWARIYESVLPRRPDTTAATLSK